MRAHMKVLTYFQKLTVSKSVNFSVWDIRPKIGVESSILVIMVFTTMASQIIFTVECFFPHPFKSRRLPTDPFNTDGIWWKHVCFNCETCLRILPPNPVQQHSLLHILQTRTAHFTEGLPPPHWLLLPAIHCCPLKVSYSPALKVSYLRALKVPKELTLKVSYYPECYQLAIPFQILQQHCGLNIILIGVLKDHLIFEGCLVLFSFFQPPPRKYCPVRCLHWFWC